MPKFSNKNTKMEKKWGWLVPTWYKFLVRSSMYSYGIHVTSGNHLIVYMQYWILMIKVSKRSSWTAHELKKLSIQSKIKIKKHIPECVRFSVLSFSGKETKLGRIGFGVSPILLLQILHSPPRHQPTILE
jgi:hypothetical protein